MAGPTVRSHSPKMRYSRSRPSSPRALRILERVAESLSILRAMTVHHSTARVLLTTGKRTDIIMQSAFDASIADRGVTMPELRKDLITGRWVIISSERGKRPNDFKDQRDKKRTGFCPFCAGNERTTPHEVLAYR